MSLKLLAKNDSEEFSLNTVAYCLASNTPNSIRHYLVACAEQAYPVWGELLYSLQQGESAFEHLYQMSPYEYMQQYPDKATTFDKAMLELSSMADNGITEVYDFFTKNKLIDLGGGTGYFLKTVLTKYSHMQGVLLEIPATIERAKEELTHSGLISRCQLVSGGFFEDIPKGGDVYVLRNTLNDWSDEKVIEILKNCRLVMNDAPLLIIQRLHSKHETLLNTLLLNMNRSLMRSATNGTVRSFEKLEALCRAAQLVCKPPIPTHAHNEMMIIEAYCKSE